MLEYAPVQPYFGVDEVHSISGQRKLQVRPRPESRRLRHRRMVEPQHFVEMVEPRLWPHRDGQS